MSKQKESRAYEILAIKFPRDFHSPFRPESPVSQLWFKPEDFRDYSIFSSIVSSRQTCNVHLPIVNVEATRVSTGHAKPRISVCRHSPPPYIVAFALISSKNAQRTS